MTRKHTPPQLNNLPGVSILLFVPRTQEVPNGLSIRMNQSGKNSPTHSVGQVLPATKCREVSHGIPLEPALHLALHKHGEALVEPEVLPLVVGDQVSSPRVTDLMDDNVCKRAVSCLKRRGKGSEKRGKGSEKRGEKEEKGRGEDA